MNKKKFATAGNAGTTITDLRFHKPVGHMEMQVIKTCPKWRDWMINWVTYDPKRQEYLGWSPDQYEICSETSPTDFLNRFEEASIAWEKEQGTSV